MCLIYNTIGALSHIEKYLIQNNLDEFHSITDLLNFKNDYSAIKQQIIEDHRLAIQTERQTLEDEIPRLSEVITNCEFEQNEKLNQKLSDLHQRVELLFLPNSSFISILKDLFLNIKLWAKIWSAPIFYRIHLFILTRKQNNLLKQKTIRLDFINTDFERAVIQSSACDLQSLERKLDLILEIKNFIYGAIGEHKVQIELSKLSDDYVLINDFSCTFKKPILFSNGKDAIKSIQIDHVLIAPAGVFIIETKNWSKNSIKNIDLFSPIQQVKRTNFALSKILARKKLKKHHWGVRKIPIKNIVTFINNKPNEEFHFVKILGLHELVKYITYFPSCLSKDEVGEISSFLLNYGDSKNNSCKISI